jgi:hypothetical protein
VSQHATPSTPLPLPPMDPELFRVHPERRTAFGPTGQDEAGERAVVDPATGTRAAGERDRKWTTVGRKGTAQEGRSRKWGRARGNTDLYPGRQSRPPSILLLPSLDPHPTAGACHDNHPGLLLDPVDLPRR